MSWKLVEKAVLGLAMLLAACGGSANVASCAKGGSSGLCSPLTADEQAEVDLNQGKFTEAIDLLEASLAADPEVYRRLPVLAAGYAARGGLQILRIAKAGFTSGGSLLDTFSSFIPTPQSVGAAAYKANNLADMGRAVAALQRIPAALRANADASPYAGSAIIQLTLYQAVYAVMLINQFAISPTTGKLDPEQLKTLTEADAEQILSTFIAAGQTPRVGDNGSVQEQVNAAVAKIQAQPGATSKEKIAGYVAAQKSGQVSSVATEF